MLYGGCLNGQVIVWDLSATDKRISAGKTMKQVNDDLMAVLLEVMKKTKNLKV